MTARLATLAAAAGLAPRGEVADGPDAAIVLLGPDLPRFWDIFTAAPEARDGAPDPLDRWSVRVISDMAQTLDAKPLFPFGRPPFAPFLAWAEASGEAWPSPVGPLVHADAGLFISYRGALRLPRPARVTARARPCDSCPGQPCRTACPVGAMTDTAPYDADRCRAYVTGPDGGICRTTGCQVRRACPVGPRPLPAQAAFHMRSFAQP